MLYEVWVTEVGIGLAPYIETRGEGWRWEPYAPLASWQLVSQQYEYPMQVPLGEDCISGSRCMYFDILVIVV